jgi:hypothetical protein
MVQTKKPKIKSRFNVTENKNYRKFANYYFNKKSKFANLRLKKLEVILKINPVLNPVYFYPEK